MHSSRLLELRNQFKQLLDNPDDLRHIYSDIFKDITERWTIETTFPIIHPICGNGYIGKIMFKPQGTDFLYYILKISSRVDFNVLYDIFWNSNATVVIEPYLGDVFEEMKCGYPKFAKDFTLEVSLGKVVYLVKSMKIVKFLLNLRKSKTGETKIITEYRIVKTDNSVVDVEHLFREIPNETEIIFIGFEYEKLIGKFILTHCIYERMYRSMNLMTDLNIEIQNLFYDLKYSCNLRFDHDDFVNVYQFFYCPLLDDLIKIALKKTFLIMSLAHYLDEASLLFEDYLPLDMLKVIIKEATLINTE